MQRVNLLGDPVSVTFVIAQSWRIRCLLSDVCEIWKDFTHMQIISPWPPLAWHMQTYKHLLLICVRFLVFVFIISASTFSFCCCASVGTPTHTHIHIDTHKVYLTRQSGVSLVGAEEPSLLLSGVCVPTAPHNRLLHVMSDEALILWRCALWGELRDTPGLRGSETGWDRDSETEQERARRKETEERERELGGMERKRERENKSKGGSDISSNEEHGGWCRGGHHDITICKSTTALLLPQCHSERRSGWYSTFWTNSHSQPGTSASLCFQLSDLIIKMIMTLTATDIKYFPHKGKHITSTKGCKEQHWKSWSFYRLLCYNFTSNLFVLCVFGLPFICEAPLTSHSYFLWKYQMCWHGLRLAFRDNVAKSISTVWLLTTFLE